MGAKPNTSPRHDVKSRPPNASAALDRFFEKSLKPHIEGVARNLRHQIRRDLRAAVHLVVEAVATAAAASAAVVDEDAVPKKRAKHTPVSHIAPRADDDGGGDEDHSHDLGDFSDDGVVSDADGDETSSDDSSSRSENDADAGEGHLTDGEDDEDDDDDDDEDDEDDASKEE